MNRVPVAAPSRMAPQEADAVRRAVTRVVDSSWWVGGPEVVGFEADFAAYVGAARERLVGVGNGTDALTIAFLALALPPGSAVLMAADEGGYAATAARAASLVPVAIDSGPLGPTVDSAEAGMRWAQDQVSALVVTHLHGNAVPLAELDAWRHGHGLALVEDCAQAHGLYVDTGHVGQVGDAATTSFYPTKNLGAVGDAGAVWFAAEEHAERARALRDYGWGERYRVELAGGRNSRLDAVQAAVLSARLPFLDARNERRRVIADRYADHAELQLADGVVHHAVVLTDERDKVAAALAERGVDTAIHYPWLVTQMPGLGVSGPPTPEAEARRHRILTVPCFPELTDDEVDRVCGALLEVSP